MKSCLLVTNAVFKECQEVACELIYAVINDLQCISVAFTIELKYVVSFRLQLGLIDFCVTLYHIFCSFYYAMGKKRMHMNKNMAISWAMEFFQFPPQSEHSTSHEHQLFFSLYIVF